MSAMPWFRLYNRIIDDPKLKLLAFEDRWHFVALCCLKSTGLLNEPDTDFRTRQIAVALGVQVRELDEISRRLREVELVDEALNPVAWDDLQFKSDNSTERVREYRKKQQKQPRNTVKRSRNVSVTAQETDTEQIKKEEAKASRASGDALLPVHVFDEWNERAPRMGKPCVRDRTPSRTQAVKGRIAQYSIDDFVVVFGKIEHAKFLRDGRFCTFDWVMKRTNFQKVLEGNYDD
jgi:hypothetical protein